MARKPATSETDSPQTWDLDPTYRPGLGIFLFIAGRFLSVLGCVATIWLLFAVTQGIGAALGFAVGAAAGLFIVLGGYLARQGQRYRAQSAESLMSKDKRPPVLYMRSFKDDELLDNYEAPSLPTAALPLPSEEQLVVKLLKPVGPIIAIGKPGEKLPQIGAGRMYVQDDEWQDTIADLLPKAKLVVFLAGYTRGLLWELETALMCVNPRNLVILLPYDKEQYDAFCQNTQRYFKWQLPEYDVPRKATVTKKRALLAFDDQWKPEFIGIYMRRLRLLNGPFRKKMVLKESFRPIFEQINLA